MIRYDDQRTSAEVEAKALVFIEAIPYLRQFAGKRIVVKVGGELLLDPEAAHAFAQDVFLLNSVGIRVVVVHGGGPQITKHMEALGIQAQFINGQRVTDKDTLEVASLILLGKVNQELVARINAFGSLAMGFSGVSGNIFSVVPLDPKLGFVGNIHHVQSDPVIHLLDAGYIPVISSLGSDGKGQSYNINADLAAGELAASLQAEKLVILTNTEGIYEDFSARSQLISEVDTATLAELRDKGSFKHGMIPKIESIIGALRAGVASAHVLDGRRPHAVLLEFFTTRGIGTMVFP